MAGDKQEPKPDSSANNECSYVINLLITRTMRAFRATNMARKKREARLINLEQSSNEKLENNASCTYLETIELLNKKCLWNLPGITSVVQFGRRCKKYNCVIPVGVSYMYNTSVYNSYA